MVGSEASNREQTYPKMKSEQTSFCLLETDAHCDVAHGEVDAAK